MEWVRKRAIEELCQSYLFVHLPSPSHPFSSDRVILPATNTYSSHLRRSVPPDSTPTILPRFSVSNHWVLVRMASMKEIVAFAQSRDAWMGSWGLGLFDIGVIDRMVRVMEVFKKGLSRMVNFCLLEASGMAFGV